MAATTRPKLVEPIADEIDEELLPGGPAPEVPDPDAVADDNAALSRLDTVTAPDSDAWVEPAAQGVDEHEPDDAPATIEPPRPQRKRIKRNPPGNLGPVEVERPVHLRTISTGRGIKNVTVTLLFDLDYPIDGIAAFMGEHAHSAIFRGDYLGNGLTIKDAPITTDAENKVSQKIKVQMPRFDQGVDQIEKYILPLFPEEVDLSSLVASSLSWRLNVQVDFPGTLTIHRMQESFDLTGKGASDGKNEPI